MAIACAAIWTAFSAAPLRRLSDTSHRARPFLVDASFRMRPTYTSSLPATRSGVGYSFACGSSSTITPGAVAKRAVSYTHLRAHETRHDLVCRLLLEKK